MFFLTLKLPRRRLLAGVLALLVCLTFAGLRPPAAVQTARSVPADRTAIRLRSDRDRIGFLAELGRNAEPGPLSAETLLLPREMEEGDYLLLQKAQGFDLAELAGKRIKRYVYQLQGSPLRAELLLYRGRVVGGSVFSGEPGAAPEPLRAEP